MNNTNDPREQARRRHAEKMAERRRINLARAQVRHSEAHARVAVLYMTKERAERAERGARKLHHISLSECLRDLAESLAETVPARDLQNPKALANWAFTSPDDVANFEELKEYTDNMPDDIRMTDEGFELNVLIEAAGIGGVITRAVQILTGRMAKKLGWTKKHLYRDGKYVYLYFPPAKQYPKKEQSYV